MNVFQRFLTPPPPPPLHRNGFGHFTVYNYTVYGSTSKPQYNPIGNLFHPKSIKCT